MLNADAVKRGELERAGARRFGFLRSRKAAYIGAGLALLAGGWRALRIRRRRGEETTSSA
jgi:hypothetical protein